MGDRIGRQFLRCAAGNIDFGRIEAEAAAAMKAPAGPIRLEEGYGGSKGFGNRHVEDYPSRMRQMRDLGFPTFAQFAEEVARNYTKIGEARDSRFFLIHPKAGFDFRLVIEYCAADGGFWTIVTGMPYRVARCPILFEKSRAGGSEPTPSAVVQRPRFATLSLPKSRPTNDNGS